jgi:hypothetical protein
VPVHDFTPDLTDGPKASPSFGGHPPRYDRGAAPQAYPAGVRQLSDVEGGRKLPIPFSPTDPSDIEEFLIPGFRSLDEAMKTYWSGIRIPTKDSYRFLRVKIAGGDKSLMVWNDELANGRARLPVGALNRTKWEFNKDKYSPAYLPMAIRFTSKRGDRAALVYRPVPFLVSYSFAVWAAHKRDAEYASFQIVTRFHPLAEFRMSDGHLQGNVQLRFGGSTDSSDKEVVHDQQANVKYEFSMTAEAWLPLPERIVPTVMGHVTVAKETTGNILLQTLGFGGVGQTLK